MTDRLKTSADTLLDYTVSRAGGAPGVVAMATDRQGNFYEGSAGVRELLLAGPSAVEVYLRPTALDGELDHGRGLHLPVDEDRQSAAPVGLGQFGEALRPVAAEGDA